jgi:hypothetical protein
MILTHVRVFLIHITREEIIICLFSLSPVSLASQARPKYGSDDTKPMYWQGSIRSTGRMRVLIFDVGKQNHGTTVV